jgi:hypothetical protein
MKAQSAFENGRGDPNTTLYNWLCAEIVHANKQGIDWILVPSRPVETDHDYKVYLFFAREFAKLRSGSVSVMSQVA